MRIGNHNEMAESQGAEQQTNGEILLVLVYFYFSNLSSGHLRVCFSYKPNIFRESGRVYYDLFF